MDDPKDTPPGKDKKPDFADAAGRSSVIPLPVEKREPWQAHLGRPDFNLSDRNLAQVVHDRYANDFRYSSNRRVWLHYNGKFWEEDGEGSVLLRKIADLLDHAAFKTAKRKPKDLVHLGSSACHGAIVRQLKAVFACQDDIFDQDVMLMNCPGGTYDARTGQIKPHDWKDFITKITVADPDDVCPRWLKHVEFVTCGHNGFARYLQALAGYSIFGAGREQVIIFIYGDTNNGKSTFLRAMVNAIGAGQDNGYGLGDFPAEALMVTHNAPHREVYTRLMGRRLAISTEIPDEAQWNTIMLKKLSGNEMITANKMFQNSTSFPWEGVLAMAGNSAPSFRSIDGAIRRRLHVIPFDAHVEPEDRDKGIDDKLKAEAGGILKWMIDGFQIYQAEGLVKPEAVSRATDEYVASQDHIREWVDECCQINIGFTELTTYQELHLSYVKYAESNKLPNVSKHKLNETLARMKFGPAHAPFELVKCRNNTIRGWRRIVLRSGNYN